MPKNYHIEIAVFLNRQNKPYICPFTNLTDEKRKDIEYKPNFSKWLYQTTFVMSQVHDETILEIKNG